MESNADNRVALIAAGKEEPSWPKRRQMPAMTRPRKESFGQDHGICARAKHEERKEV